VRSTIPNVERARERMAAVRAAALACGAQIFHPTSELIENAACAAWRKFDPLHGDLNR